MPTDDPQAIAARLYADLVEFEDRGHTEAEVVAWLSDRLSAHVETLTQQVAELKALEKQDDADWAVHTAQVIRAEQAEQENARLTADLADANQQLEVLKPGGRYAWKSKFEQAEQQRDAAHAALRGFVELLSGQTEPLHPVCWITALVAADAALAASAPQKEPEVVPRDPNRPLPACYSDPEWLARYHAELLRGGVDERLPAPAQKEYETCPKCGVVRPCFIHDRPAPAQETER